jgi:quercetin dioxygenase-like cupin family protein
MGLFGTVFGRSIQKIERQVTESSDVISDIIKNGIPHLEELIREVADSQVSYRMEDGSCLGYKLWHEEGELGAGQRAWLQAGAIFPEHAHSQKEMLIGLTGAFEAVTPNETKILCQFDTIIFEPNIPHHVHGIADAWMVGIIIPASKAYPK